MSLQMQIVAWTMKVLATRNQTTKMLRNTSETL